MKKNLFNRLLKKVVLATLFFVFFAPAFSQCTFTSSDGYKVTVAVQPVSVVVTNCTGNGFQYEIKYNYSVTFSTPPPANEGLWTLQGILNCGSISINLPIAGGIGTTTSANNAYYSGTTPTCANATPANIGCNSVSIHIYAHGIPDQTVNCPFSSSILPVTFLNFSATTQNSSVKLNWSTTSETNNSFFSIEKSTDSENWTTIGKITGAGTSTQVNNYVFEDDSPSFATAYYRIKQTDIDGNFSYSSIIYTGSSLNNKLGIFPNPNSGNNISINGIQSTSGWQLKLMNVASQVVYATYLSTSATQLQLPQIPAGIYLIQLSNASTGVSSVFKYLKN